MNITISLRSEWLKVKRTSAVYTCLLAAAVVPVIYFFDSLMDADAVKRLRPDPWNLYLRPCWQGMTLLILPLFVILVNTLVPQIEFRNHTWKQVRSSPQPRWQLYLGKFLLVQGLVLLCLLSFDVLLLLSLYGLAMLKPEAGFSTHALDWTQFWASNAKAFASVLGLGAAQYWMGMRFRNFILPIGAGFCLWFIGGLLGLELQFPYIDLYPHAFPILVVYPKYAHLTGLLLLRSFLFCIAFLVLGYWNDNAVNRQS